jgi:hypothetical protein
MNNSFLSFAFLTLGLAAFLSACSDDGGSSPADLCKNGPSKACLVGEWRFDGIEEDASTDCWGNLVIDDESSFSFEGGCGGPTFERGKGYGPLSLNEKNIAVTCLTGDCDGDTRRGTVNVDPSGMKMSIKSNSSEGIVSWYQSTRVTNPTEKFTRK